MSPGSFLARLRERLQVLLPPRFRARFPVVPVVRLSGVIGAVLPLRPGLSLSAVAPMLERAFTTAGAKAVAIIVNSPGGSAVQSHLVFRRIRAHADESKLPVLVFIEDAAASGGYMIACAGDEIFADPSSLVGSIGVVSASFGFPELLKKIGVERRVYTAGTNKATLDPFQKEKPEDIERLKALQLEVHETFIDMVRERRGARLTDDPDLFTGLFWSGKRGLALGLVDGLGDMRSFLRARYGDKVRLRLIQPQRGLFGRRLGFMGLGAGPETIAAAAAQGLADTAGDRALWSRYGL
jgi:signal peptide peptidase SppA